MQGDPTATMDMSPSAPTSPPTTPYRHKQTPSTASILMQRAKRSSSRVTDGVVSRTSDDDGNRTAVKVGMYDYCFRALAQV